MCEIIPNLPGVPFDFALRLLIPWLETGWKSIPPRNYVNCACGLDNEKSIRCRSKPQTGLERTRKARWGGSAATITLACGQLGFGFWVYRFCGTQQVDRIAVAHSKLSTVFPPSIDNSLAQNHRSAISPEPLNHGCSVVCTTDVQRFVQQGFQLKLWCREVYYTNALILLVKILLFSTLHCIRVFKL